MLLEGQALFVGGPLAFFGVHLLAIQEVSLRGRFGDPCAASHTYILNHQVKVRSPIWEPNSPQDKLFLSTFPLLTSSRWAYRLERADPFCLVQGAGWLFFSSSRLNGKGFASRARLRGSRLLSRRSCKHDPRVFVMAEAWEVGRAWAASCSGWRL